MDVILEIIDTFIGDELYATLLPAHTTPYDFPNYTVNATALPLSIWKYKPSTYMFSLEPSEAAYMSAWPRDNIFRQFTSLFLITWLFGLINCFVFATLSYIFIFDKNTFNHPKFLNNQISLEMKQANRAMPIMAVCTALTFVAEVRGFCKLYDATENGPGRCHVFHPLEGFAQSVPYHINPMLFPLNKLAYVLLSIFVNLWTILIHDGEYITDNPIINGSACHTAHHLYFNYRKPDLAWFNKKTKMSRETWESNIKEMEDIQREVEGADDRQYVTAEIKKKN
ncbi:putative fatty acid hydroxylase superfamily protein [Colletotrichum sublineola]|uniref:Putative fatty acid hydroxylase superfamily protein n=1 Tax=Colletotrichum sublineola TaxID=1173701 RepID=A0A066XL62_COLSU|nr:putative fatty acid hydroxylase superfamily protein [Colletotrichum sublineola]